MRTVTCKRCLRAVQRPHGKGKAMKTKNEQYAGFVHVVEDGRCAKHREALTPVCMSCVYSWHAEREKANATTAKLVKACEGAVAWVAAHLGRSIHCDKNKRAAQNALDELKLINEAVREATGKDAVRVESFAEFQREIDAIPGGAR